MSHSTQVKEISNLTSDSEPEAEEEEELSVSLGMNGPPDE